MFSLPEITRQVFEAFQPTLQGLQAEVSRHPNLAVVRSGILEEDAPFVATIGLSCERTDDTLPGVTFSIGCLLLRHPEATHAIIRAEVGWYHGAALGGSDGFSIYEAMTPPIRYVDASTINAFARRFLNYATHSAEASLVADLRPLLALSGCSFFTAAPHRTTIP